MISFCFCLDPGYRSVPLKNAYSEECELSCLLVHIDIRSAMVCTCYSLLCYSDWFSVHSLTKSKVFHLYWLTKRMRTLICSWLVGSGLCDLEIGAPAGREGGNGYRVYLVSCYPAHLKLALTVCFLLWWLGTIIGGHHCILTSNDEKSCFVSMMQGGDENLYASIQVLRDRVEEISNHMENEELRARATIANLLNQQNGPMSLEAQQRIQNDHQHQMENLGKQLRQQQDDLRRLQKERAARFVDWWPSSSNSECTIWL